MSQFPKRLVDQLGDGPSRRLLESARIDEPPARLVAAAILGAAGNARASEPPESGVGPTPQPVGRRKIALVAGTLLVGGMLVWGVNELRSEAPRATVPVTVTAPANVVENVPKAEAPSTIEGTAATSVTDLPNAPAASPAPSTSPRPSAAIAVNPKPVEATAVEQTADLLREANRLRAQARWAEAAATYEKVIDLGPGSAEAYPADVALGNLELQQGRPVPALARYEHALASRPTGALAEEARWGKARALRAAGRITEERAALIEFRSRHPDSPLVPAATQRLAEMGN